MERGGFVQWVSPRIAMRGLKAPLLRWEQSFRMDGTSRISDRRQFMKCVRRSATWCVAVSLALLASVGARGAEWPVKRGPSHEPTPYKYDHAAWKDVPREYL